MHSLRLALGTNVCHSRTQIQEVLTPKGTDKDSETYCDGFLTMFSKSDQNIDSDLCAFRKKNTVFTFYFWCNKPYLHNTFTFFFLGMLQFSIEKPFC